MKPLFFEFEATTENPKFHFENKNCNLEFIFGMPQTYTREISFGGDQSIERNLVPLTVHNLGLCTVTFEVSAGLYCGADLEATLRFPSSEYSNGITVEPNEFFTHSIEIEGHSYGLTKIIGQIRLECEKITANISDSTPPKSKKKKT